MRMPLSLSSPVPVVFTQQAHLKRGHGGVKIFWINSTYRLPPHSCRLGYRHNWVPCFPATAAVSEPLIGSHFLRRPDSHLAASWLFWTPFPQWIFSYWYTHSLWNWVWLFCLPCFARHTIWCHAGCLVVRLNQTILLQTKEAPFAVKEVSIWMMFMGFPSLVPQKWLALWNIEKVFLKTQ